MQEAVKFVSNIFSQGLRKLQYIFNPKKNKPETTHQMSSYFQTNVAGNVGMCLSYKLATIDLIHEESADFSSNKWN